MLETAAMVLTEAAAGGGLAGRASLGGSDGEPLLPARLDAVALTKGLGMGEAVMHQHGIVIPTVVPDLPEEELARLSTAFAEMQKALDDLIGRSQVGVRGEPLEVLETFRLFAQDRGWLSRIQNAIKSGLTAPAAVQKVQAETRIRMEQISDPYLRERLSDLEELANRLLRHLTGAAGAAGRDLPEQAILIARNLGPGELLDYDPACLKGLILSEGTAASHVAIIARALGLPLLGHCSDALTRIRPGDFVIVDAGRGQALVRPGRSVRDSFAGSLELKASHRDTLAATRGLPAVSLDGVRITLAANAGLLMDLPQARNCGAEGIGL